MLVLTRVEATAQNRHDALGLVLGMIRPLPFVSEFGLIARLIIRRIHVVHARLQTGIHDRQILVRQRHIDHQVGLDLLDQTDRRLHVVRVDLRDIDGRLAFLGNRFTARDTPRGQMNLFEHVAVHRALLRGHRAGSSRSNDENAVQFK